MNSDIEKASYQIYPEDWFAREINGVEFKHDNNASKRAVAQEVLKYVFNVIDDKDTASHTAQAFLRRIGVHELTPEMTVAMSTALLAVRLAIRDGVNQNNQTNTRGIEVNNDHNK